MAAEDGLTHRDAALDKVDGAGDDTTVPVTDLVEDLRRELHLDDTVLLIIEGALGAHTVAGLLHGLEVGVSLNIRKTGTKLDHAVEFALFKSNSDLHL